MKVRIGISISCPFSSEAQAVAGVAELEEISWVSTHGLQQTAIALIDLIPPIPQGSSAVSDKANLANRLQQLPLNSHGGTTTSHSLLQQRQR